MSEVPIDDDDTFDVVYRNWLVARRVDNQKTAIRLHVLIRTYAVGISEREHLIKAAMGLVKAASSLWRAAFLSDRLDAYDDFEEDDFFLTDGIIQKEFVADPAARAAPDWPFFLHMSNARDALISVTTLSDPRIIAPAEIPAWVGSSYKECWVRHQLLLDRAVDAFEIACAVVGPGSSAAEIRRAKVAVSAYQGKGLPS